MAAAKKSTKSKDTRSTSDRLVDAALELAATQRWRDLSLAKISAHAGVPIGEALLNHSSRLHILYAIADRIDVTVMLSLEDDPLDGTTKDMLFDVLMRRFDVMADHRAAMASISAGLRRDPLSAACLGKRFLKSMALSLQAAGVSTENCSGAIKTKVLGAIHLNAFKTWLKDEDQGLSQTMSTLDKDLSRAENFAGRASKVDIGTPESA